MVIHDGGARRKRPVERRPNSGALQNKQVNPMKALRLTTLALLTLSAPVALSVLAMPKKNARPLVNAYGEPAGFGKLPDVVVADSPGLYLSASRPGTGGLYVLPGYVDPRSYESSGQRQVRLAAESPGTVTIGALEVLDSGPTGPMPADALEAANEEVTTQVLTRIKATDRAMASLRSRSKSLDDDTQARFKAAAADVAERRQALRENLKTVRSIGGEQWSNARAEVAVSFNAYVESLHRAEAVVGASATS